MTDFVHARRTMVDNQLRTSGITDRRVLAAMGEVPRERFVAPTRQALAYIDEAQSMGEGRKLGAPAPFGKLLQLAAISHTDKVLDLGCGSGYSAAVLAKLAASVVAVEYDATLAVTAKSNLASLGIVNVEVVQGKLESAGGSKGPFDVIVIEGTTETVPDALFSELAPEGRVVALIGAPGRPAVAQLFAKSGKGVAARAEFDARLPPLSSKGDESFVF